MSVLCCLPAAAREVYSINSNWKFFNRSERDSLTVSLPHTWNTDAIAGRSDYYRGVGNYLKYVDINPEWKGKRLFVRFMGANSVANLMVNGRHAGQHEGGGSAFVFEVTDLVDFSGRNLFWITVNNGERIDVLPTAGTENAYGGIFRDVELIVAENAVIGLDGYGSEGVMVRTAKVSAEKAEGNITVRVNSRAARTVRINVKIADAAGETVCENSIRPKTEKGIGDHSVPFTINSPVLWNGTLGQHLYDVSVTLVDGVSEDEVTVRTGIRSFEVDPATGFHLNGAPYPLKGVELRRDRAIYGPVSRPGQLRRDVEIIREMGANAIHVAGGPHSPEFYRLCDEYGLIVVTDLPFNGAMTLERKGFYDTAGFRANARQQLREMIYQLGNHPSIMVWSLFSYPELRGDNPVPFIRELKGIAETVDPGRLTAGTSTRDGEVNTITDLIVFDHSFGWTEGVPEDIGIWAVQFRDNPAWNGLRAAVSYRCGASVNHQQEELQRARRTEQWHPENWQTHFHEVYLRELGGGERFWALFVGDIFEYGSAEYGSGDGTGVDDCGLVTFDRQTRKDAFYLYKANWNAEEPFVHIVGKRNGERAIAEQEIRVFSNLGEVELFVNGESAGTKEGDRGTFVWRNVPMQAGHNAITAVSGDYSDTAAVRIVPGGKIFR